jgi:hypothetical protein
MTDPFDDLDEDGDEERDGDPFAELGDAAESTDGTDAKDGNGDAGHVDPDPTDSVEPQPDPFEYLGDAGPDVSAAADDDVGREAPDPEAGDVGEGEQVDVADGEQVDVAGDLFGDVDVSRGDPFEAAESPFEQFDVEGVDPDEVWERFTEDASADSTVDQPEDDVVVVSKHEFCEGCPYFTPPPEIECTHAGTTILEFVGPDDVRVENCPIVQERRELGEVHE